MDGLVELKLLNLLVVLVDFGVVSIVEDELLLPTANVSRDFLKLWIRFDLANILAIASFLAIYGCLIHE